MKSVYEVICSACGGVINTQQDHHRKQTDISLTVRYWHLPACPKKGGKIEIITHIADLARTVH